MSIPSGARNGHGFDLTLALLALAYLLIFSAFPLVYNIVMSFQEVDMFSLAALWRPFVGLTNYLALFANPDFWPIMLHTAIFVALYGDCPRSGWASVIGSTSGVPYTSLVDVWTRRRTPARRTPSRTFNVPRTFVSTNDSAAT